MEQLEQIKIIEDTKIKRENMNETEIINDLNNTINTILKEEIIINKFNKIYYTEDGLKPITFIGLSMLIEKFNNLGKKINNNIININIENDKDLHNNIKDQFCFSLKERYPNLESKYNQNKNDPETIKMILSEGLIYKSNLSYILIKHIGEQIKFKQQDGSIGFNNKLIYSITEQQTINKLLVFGFLFLFGIILGFIGFYQEVDLLLLIGVVLFIIGILGIGNIN